MVTTATRAVRILITPELLRHVLCLPLAADINDAHWVDGLVALTVEHPDLPEVENGADPPFARHPIFFKNEPASLVDWGIQK